MLLKYAMKNGAFRLKNSIWPTNDLENAFKVTNFVKIIQLSSLVFFGKMLPSRVISVNKLKWPILYVQGVPF